MNEKQAAVARRSPSAEDIRRAATAFELSAARLTERQIAERMGTSPATAHRLVKRGMRFYLADHGAEVLRRDMLARLNLVTEVLMPRVLDGDLQALDRMLKVEKRIADLVGLDAPKTVKVQPVYVDELAAEVERLRALEEGLAANDHLPQPIHAHPAL